MTNKETKLYSLRRLESLGRRGFIISIVYGPCGKNPPQYSVDVLAPSGESFDIPYSASDFEHAILIAEYEIEERGWGGAAWEQ